jgi:hypothetical protein
LSPDINFSGEIFSMRWRCDDGAEIAVHAGEIGGILKLEFADYA